MQTIVALETQYVLLILSVCLQAYVFSLQCACAIWSSVACPAMQYSSTWSDLFFKKKKKIIEYKLFVPIFFLKFCLKHFVFLEELSEILLKMYIGLHVKYLLLLSDFNETWIFSTDFRKKTTNIKFNENPSCGSRVIPCGRTDRHDEDNSRFL